MFGLVKGTRHYIQYQLTDEEGWKDLLFIDPMTSNIQGLWVSRSYLAANARIEELMAECGTDRSQYRIVRRTWAEQVLEHDPNYGKAFNDPSYEYDQDADSDKAVDADDAVSDNDEPQFEVVNESTEK